MEFDIKEIEQIRKQLISIEQEHSKPFNIRINLENIPLSEIQKTLQDQLSQSDHTIKCVSGIALFLIDKYNQLLDQLAYNEDKKWEIDKEDLIKRESQHELEMKLKQKLEKKRRSSINFQQQVEQLQNQIKNIQIKLASTSQKKRLFKLKNEDLLLENKQLFENNGTLRQQIESLQKKLDKKKEKIQLLKLSNNMQQSKTNENQILQLQRQIKEDNSKFNQLQSEFALTKNKNLNLEKEISQEKSESYQYIREIQSLSNELQNLKQSLQQLTEYNTILKQKKQRLKQDLQEYKKQFHSIQKERDFTILQDIQEDSPEKSPIKPSLKQIQFRINLSAELNDLAASSSTTANKDLMISERDIFSPETIEIESLASSDRLEVQSKKISEHLFAGFQSRRPSATIKVNQRSKSEQNPQAMKFVNNNILQIQLNEYIECKPMYCKRIIFPYCLDPIENHFFLLTQSCKINSPNLDLICTVDSKKLFSQCMAEQVPVHKVILNLVILMDRKRVKQFTVN